jgi:hypothetical protein
MIILPRDPFRINFLNHFKHLNSSDSTSNGTVVFTINQPKLIDLSIRSLQFTLSTKSYKSFDSRPLDKCEQSILLLNVTYEVSNLGVSMNETVKWMDNIEIWCDAGNSSGSGKNKSDNEKLLTRVDLYVAKLLRFKHTYTNTHEFALEWPKANEPMRKCKVKLFVNADNNLFELSDKQNNQRSTCCFELTTTKSRAHMEIMLTKATINQITIDMSNESMPAKLYTDEPIVVQFVYNNTGTGTALPFFDSSYWSDYAYVYNSSSVSVSDLLRDALLVGTRKQSKLELECMTISGVYTWRLLMPATLPSSHWYFYMSNDFDRLYAPDRLLNSRVSLSIAKRAPCDLIAQHGSLQTQAGANSGWNLMAGELIRFTFTVKNIGVGKARGKWYDAIYLGTRPSLSSLDIKLLSTQRAHELDTNDTYTTEHELQLPITLKSATYFLIYFVDSLRSSNDLNYENNQDYLTFSVSQIPSVDIYIVENSLNASLLSDSQVRETSRQLKLSWLLGADRSVNAAYKCEKFYVAHHSSANETSAAAAAAARRYGKDFTEIESSADKLCERFGIVELASRDTTSQTVPLEQHRVVEIPRLLAEGSYRAVLSTITSVQEPDYENNRAQSVQTFNVSVDELFINVERGIDMRADQTKLFKFASTFETSSFRVELSTNSTNALHDLYTLDDRVPDENNYRARSRLPFSFNQSIIVRDARVTVYYIIVKPYMPIDAYLSYKVKIAVLRIDDIQLESVYPLQLSLLGPTTLKLTGNFVPSLLDVCLRRPNAIGDLLCAERSKTHRFSTDLVYATFDTSKALSSGLLVQENETMLIRINHVNTNKSIQLIGGQIGSVKLKMTRERLIYLPNQTAVIKLVMSNQGNTDAHVPFGLLSTKELSSRSQLSPSSYTSESLLSSDNDGEKNDDDNGKTILADWLNAKPDYTIQTIDGTPANIFIRDSLILFNSDGLGSVLQPGTSTSISLELTPDSPTLLGRYELYFYTYKANFIQAI